jgi:hypothetical protein
MEETSNDLLHFSLFKFCKYSRQANPWLIVIRTVVHRHTNGCPLPCALSYEQLDNILVAIIFEGNDVKPCWDACWHYK